MNEGLVEILKCGRRQKVNCDFYQKFDKRKNKNNKFFIKL